MILIDSDVYAIHLMYPRDARFALNQHFLSQVRPIPKATTIFNLLEICGKASFSLSLAALQKLYRNFDKNYRVRVLFPKTQDLSGEEFLQRVLIQRSLHKILTRMAFLDALILSTAEDYPEIDTFVTWNARHFRGKTSLSVLTPREYLEERRQAGGAGNAPA